MELENKFECWAVIELFGKTQLAGYVKERVVFGTSFCQITVPDTNNGNTIGFTKLFGPSAIYAVTPVSEEYARVAAERVNADPIEYYDHRKTIEILAKQLKGPGEKAIERPVITDEELKAALPFEDDEDYEDGSLTITDPGFFDEDEGDGDIW